MLPFAVWSSYSISIESDFIKKYTCGKIYIHHSVFFVCFVLFCITSDMLIIFFPGKKTNKEGTAGYIPSIFAEGKISTTPITPRTTNTSRRAGNPTPVRRVERRPRTIFRPVWRTTDHDYVCTKVDPNPPIEVDILRKRIMDLEDEVCALSQRILSLDTIKRSDDDCAFYTNFPTYGIFKAVSDYLERRAASLRYWNGSEELTRHQPFSASMRTKPGPDRKFSFEEEFFMTVVRLKLGGTGADLAMRFGCGESHFSRIFTTMVTFIAKELSILFEMKDDDDNVAECFRDMPDLAIIIDCTEQPTERSSDLHARKLFFSNYKNRDTLKWMVGLSRNLTVNYVSPAYGGRASDKHITVNSGLLDVLEGGTSAMADRGFPVCEELKALGVKLILPDFKGRNRSQMSRGECEQSEFVAKIRIHIERIIQRIRTYHIFDSAAKLSMKDIYDSIFTSCAYLTNFQLPIIKPTPMHPQELWCLILSSQYVESNSIHVEQRSFWVWAQLVRDGITL